MVPREATQPPATKEVGNDSGNETSQLSRSLRFHAISPCSIPNTAQIVENLQGGGATMPTSLPSLPPRGQPFPFILPQPLGPLSSPTRSLDQADLATRRSAPGTSALDTSTWGCPGVNPLQPGGSIMPYPGSVPTTELTRHLSLENMIGQRPITPHRVFSHEIGNQSLSKPAANRWHAPATGTHFPPRREVYASALEGTSDEGTCIGNSEVVQYHKCDECHEAFTSSSWLKRHKTTHFQRFRCGCGAAYIDKDLLLVSSYPSQQQLWSRLIFVEHRNTRRTRSASRGLLIRKWFGSGAHETDGMRWNWRLRGSLREFR